MFVYVRVCARKKKVPSSSAAEGRLSTGRGGPTERRERVSEKVTGLEKQFCVPRVCVCLCVIEREGVLWWVEGGGGAEGQRNEDALRRTALEESIQPSSRGNACFDGLPLAGWVG